MPIQWKTRKYLYFAGIFIPMTLVLFITLWLIFATFIKPDIPQGKQDTIRHFLILVFFTITATLAFVSWSLAQKEMLKRENDAKIRDSEARFRTLLNSAPDAIVIVDPEGRINIVNNQAEKWFGYNREELIGQRVEMLVPERYRDRHHQHRASYANNPGTRPMGGNAELFGLRKDGREFPLEISLSPSEIGGQVWVTSIVRDISARKEMQQARHLAQTRYLELVNNLPVGVFRISGSDSARFREVNPAMLEIFSADSAEALLTTPLDALFSEKSNWLIYQRQLHSQLAINTIEVPLRALNGREFFASITTAIKHSASEGTFFDGILEDISDRKKQERHIQQLNDDLKRRSMELEIINRELESFSYSVSHDLRAPLRAIDGFSSTLLKDYGDRLDRRGHDRLQRVRTAAQRMANLIDDLLNLSRVSRSDIVLQDINLSEIARDIVADLQQAEPDRRMEVDIQPELRAEGDKRLMSIALTNLLTNAWKFTGHTDQPRIELARREQEPNPVFYVRDNGAGFDMEFSSKLFGAFQRLHDADEFPGTGIGLATVQRVIHKHGGRIWAEGAVNHGATFYFTLKNRGDV